MPNIPGQALAVLELHAHAAAAGASCLLGLALLHVASHGVALLYVRLLLTQRAVQVVLAPHFYCPGVSLETRAQCYAGKGQWEGFDNTVGYLTVAPGYCATGGKCKVHSPCSELGSLATIMLSMTMFRVSQCSDTCSHVAGACLEKLPHSKDLCCRCLLQSWTNSAAR